MMFGMFDPRIDNCGFMLAPLYKPFLNFVLLLKFRIKISDQNLKIIVYALSTVSHINYRPQRETASSCPARNISRFAVPATTSPKKCGKNAEQ